MPRRDPTPEQAEQLAKLQALITAAGITHFTALEVCWLRYWRVYDIPPEELFPNIIPTLLCAEDIRSRVQIVPGREVYLIMGNGWRSRAYNKERKGHWRSQHMRLRAADLDLPPEFQTTTMCRHFYRVGVEIHTGPDAKREKMGIGLYSRRGGRRMHIDTGHRWRYWGGLWGSYYRQIRKEVR